VGGGVGGAVLLALVVLSRVEWGGGLYGSRRIPSSHFCPNLAFLLKKKRDRGRLGVKFRGVVGVWEKGALEGQCYRAEA